MLFAASLDAGLIPFYAFTAFAANRQYTESAYNWGTLFNNAQITENIAHVLFLISTVCGALHVVSFVISVYLATVFRQIAKLPPDMNPLEDNLTARPHKRSKSEVSEKYRSVSTLDSLDANSRATVEDPLMGEPRTIPFMHTRQNSSDTTPGQQQSAQTSSDEKRASGTSIHSHRLSRSDLPSQQRRLYEQSNQSKSSLTRSSAHRSRNPSSRPTSMVLNDAPALRPSANEHVPTDFRWGSPVSSLESDNWVAYPSRPSSPVNENIARRSNSIESRNNTLPSFYSGASDWLSSAQKYGRDVSEEKARGEYTALQNQEDDENAYQDHHAEQDLGERHQPDDGQASNPLGMNPATPQPKEEEQSASWKESLRHPALTDLPNPSVNINRAGTKGRFYGELEGTGLSVPRVVSNQEMQEEKPKIRGSKKLRRRKSGKSSAYEALKTKDDDDDSDDPETPESAEKQRSTEASNDSIDSDRKGRVVSNSGIDLGAGFQLGSGSNSYSSYIAEMGVGRRRDRNVSGKVAEEGRGGAALYAKEENTPGKKRGSTIRAAGWARFAGL